MPRRPSSRRPPVPRSARSRCPRARSPPRARRAPRARARAPKVRPRAEQRARAAASRPPRAATPSRWLRWLRPAPPADDEGDDDVAVDLLVVGLGNPGVEYANTRHNCGADAIGLLAERHGGSLRRDKVKALADTIT